MHKDLSTLTQWEYTQLEQTGRLYEFYPEATGNYTFDVLHDAGLLDTEDEALSFLVPTDEEIIEQLTKDILDD
jgi:hypothetical protein